MPQRDLHRISLITASQVVFGTEEQCQLQGEMPHPKRFRVYRRLLFHNQIREGSANRKL
jgi:hypothetical protein